MATIINTTIFGTAQRNFCNIRLLEVAQDCKDEWKAAGLKVIDDDGVASQKGAATAKADGIPNITNGRAIGIFQDSSYNSNGYEVSIAALHEKNE